MKLFRTKHMADSANYESFNLNDQQGVLDKSFEIFCQYCKIEANLGFDGSHAAKADKSITCIYQEIRGIDSVDPL